MLGRVEACCRHLLGHRIPDTIRHTLTERTRGRLDSGSLVELRMPGGDAVKLAEFLHLIEREIKAGKMKP